MPQNCVSITVTGSDGICIIETVEHDCKDKTKVTVRASRYENEGSTIVTVPLDKLLAAVRKVAIFHDVEV